VLRETTLINLWVKAGKTGKPKMSKQSKNNINEHKIKSEKNRNEFFRPDQEININFVEIKLVEALNGF
jgi:hypothetical protein